LKGLREFLGLTIEKRKRPVDGATLLGELPTSLGNTARRVKADNRATGIRGIQKNQTSRGSRGGVQKVSRLSLRRNKRGLGGGRGESRSPDAREKDMGKKGQGRGD